MKVSVTIDLEVDGLGHDEKVSARMIAGDAFKLAVDKLRAFGVVSVAFVRNGVSITVGNVPSPLGYRALLQLAGEVEQEVNGAFYLARRAAQDEIPTDPRLPVAPDPASSP